MADFQDHIDDFKRLDTALLAASVDSLSAAEKIIHEAGLTFPVAYGLKAEPVAEKTGVYYHEDRKFLQPASFLFNRKGTIQIAAYSSGPIGRLTAEDTLQLVDHLQKENEIS